MNEGQISTRYARALLLSLHGEPAASTVYDSARRMVPILRSARRELTQVLTNALVSHKEKISFVRSLFARFAPSLVSFAELMINRGRGLYLERALLVFLTLYRKQHAIVHTRIVTAAPLQPSSLACLHSYLQARFGSGVEVEEIVDSALIGGFQLEVDGRLLDRSVSWELAQIASQILV